MPMYRVRTVFTGVAGSPWYSNLYFAQEGGTHIAARQAATDFWYILRNEMANDVLFTVEPDVPVIDEATGDIINVLVDLSPKSDLGTQASAMAPRATQGLIRTRTGTYSGGREIRGRVFVPGVTQASVGDGRPTTGYVDSLNEASEALVETDLAQWVVWAKTRGVYAVVNSTSAWTEFSVLRSRRD